VIATSEDTCLKEAFKPFKDACGHKLDSRPVQWQTVEANPTISSANASVNSQWATSLFDLAFWLRLSWAKAKAEWFLHQHC